MENLAMNRYRDAGLLLVFFAIILGQSFAAERRPNVVIFLSDDQGWGDLSVHGNTQLQTPNIDSLARDGALFDRFFVCPVCSPTRAEFLTGRYHPRGGVRGVSTGLERLNIDEKTIADAFHAAGYATAAFGKWHNGSQWPYHPLARGFREYYGFTSGHWGEYFNPPLEHNGQFVRGRGFIADDLTDHALAFIEQNQHQPFFCYVPFNTPHSPFAVPDEYWQRHKNQSITMRGNEGQNESLDVTRCVLAMCENLDSNVGRVLRRLDELKLAEDTIVIYFADNGPNSFRWNGGMKGRKGSTDEGGVRVPCLIRWSGKIPPGTRVREIAGAIDLFPTLSKLTGIPFDPPKPFDGRDVSPLLMGSTSSWPDRMIFSHWGGRVSVRTQQYRLDDGGALFDMAADPNQARNIATEQSEVAERLTAAVKEWRADVLRTPAVAGNTKEKGVPRQSLGTREGKKKAKGAAEPADSRPYPVGYAEFPMTPLPARDGIPHGGVKRSSSAPNCSYFVNWTSTNDSMTWDVEVATAGEYDVTIYFTCPERDAGSTVELAFLNSKLSGKVTPGWDPPLYTDQDTIPRPPAESQMKDFRPLQLGSMHLEKGRDRLTLRATDIPGKSVMDVRLLTLTLKKG
jgi:arylsulfatase A-like enzyme